MKLTLQKAKKMMDDNNGSLYLSGTGITKKKLQKLNAECIEITKGQYNAERFAEFFGEA